MQLLEPFEATLEKTQFFSVEVLLRDDVVRMVSNPITRLIKTFWTSCPELDCQTDFLLQNNSMEEFREG